MTISLDEAIVYDIETTPVAFTMNVQGLFSELDMTFEISHYRDDRQFIIAWFQHWHANQTPMVSFNGIGFDYPVIHELWINPSVSVEDIYEHAMAIIESQHGRFGFTVWESDRFAPQIDLYRVHHFDNRAKSTSLKALQFNMRSTTVMEMPLPFGIALTPQQIDDVLIPYNRHDVSETKRFAHISMDAIKFRIGLTSYLKGDVLNWSDTKIGGRILEQRLGDDVCYERDPETNRKSPRQTFRQSIPLADIIFPYIQFSHPEFNRILAWMRTQTLSSDELTESIQTKGVFTGVSCNVGGLDFHFGTGGIHGSVSAQRFAADSEYALVDIDVAALYPSIAIVNGLYPEHLGEAFTREYAKLPIERSKHKKGTVENAAFKLASNGTYGNSNNQYSVFYDPRFTMAITINGQLMLCMLAEWLLSVPSLQIIQINTDGVTYRVHRSLLTYVEKIRAMWEQLTKLKLEEVRYERMWIRDVNNYIAQPEGGKLPKLKGAYWYPVNFPDDISNASPPAWHKDLSNQVSIMAAVAHMTKGVDIGDFIRGHADPFDFMCRGKVDRASKLMIGDQEVQRICRYFVSTNGGAMKKISPPTGPEGTYKRKNGMSDYEYQSILATLAPGTHDERIHTKNRSKYITREMSIESGYLVTECNDARRFDFESLNYEYYVDQARKLVIP